MIYQTSEKDLSATDSESGGLLPSEVAEIPPPGWEFMFNEPVFEEEREELELIPRHHLDEDVVKANPLLRPHLDKYKEWRVKRDQQLFS